MTDVIVERRFDPPLPVEDFPAMAEEGADCLALYDVEWMESYLSRDGKLLVCHFQSSDTENTRTALLQQGSLIDDAWPATLHDGPATDKIPNVMVVRRFDSPADLAAIQAIEDAGATCLELRDVTFIQTLFSVDQKRMMCLYHAPDAESVRTAQREAGMPIETVWACQVMKPD